MKTIDPSIQIVAVEPVESPVLRGGQHSAPSPGNRAGFIPAIYNAKVVDRIVDVAWTTLSDGRRSARGGILVASHRPILWAALEWRRSSVRQRVVAVLRQRRAISVDATVRVHGSVDAPARSPRRRRVICAAQPARFAHVGKASGLAASRNSFVLRNDAKAGGLRYIARFAQPLDLRM